MSLSYFVNQNLIWHPNGSGAVKNAFHTTRLCVEFHSIHGSLEAEIFANNHFCWKQLANPDGFKILVEPDPFQCCHIPLNKPSTTLGTFETKAIRERVLQLFHVGVMDLYRETLCVLDYKVHNRTAEQCTCEGSEVKMQHVNAAEDC